MSQIDEFIKSRKIIVCGGTGGVGKTTLSSTIAVRAAQLGLTVLVLTVDPAKRLAAALGLENVDEEKLVPGQNFPGKLYASMVDQKRILDRFVRQSGLSPTAVEHLLNNIIYQKLSTTLSGSQEFTALEKLYQSYETGKYDLIVLDTPPAAHAVEFFDSAQKLSAFFQDSIAKWFTKPFEGQGRLATWFQRGTNLAFKAFERLTGADFLNEILDFVSKAYGLKDRLRERMDAVNKLLLEDTTSFILVTAFDATKISEARRYEGELRDRGYHLNYVIINRAFPVWGVKPDLSTGLESRAKLITYYEQLREFFARHESAFEAFRSDLKARYHEHIEFLRIPDVEQDVYDLKSLEKISNVLSSSSRKD